MAYDVVTPTRLGGDELDVSPVTTTLRTTPAGSRDIVTNINIANNASTVAQVTIYMVPSGGTANDTTVVIPMIKVPKNTVISWSGSQVSHEGGTIVGTSTVAGVCVTISGGEVA